MMFGQRQQTGVGHLAMTDLRHAAEPRRIDEGDVVGQKR